MKTALESYIEWLKSNIKIAEEYQLNNIKLLNVCLENAERFLPMEKEQMKWFIQVGYYAHSQGHQKTDELHEYWINNFKTK